MSIDLPKEDSDFKVQTMWGERGRIAASAATYTFSDTSTIDHTDTSGTITADVKTDSIDNTLLANMADSTIKGRHVGGGTGDPEDLTATQAASIVRKGQRWSLNRVHSNVRQISSGRRIQYVSALDKVLIFESSTPFRLVSISQYTDHHIPLFTAAGGKVPGSWCYASTSGLIWAAAGSSSIFSVDTATWTNPTSGAASRCDHLLYAAGSRHQVYGFDNGVTPTMKQINPSTGAIIASTTVGLTTGIGVTTDQPWVYATSNDCIYLSDSAGAIRKFNCASNAVTLITAVTAAGGGVQSLLMGSDGYIYIVNTTGAANKQKVTVLNPATDTLLTTIDLSSHLYATTAGFWAIAEWDGYLYASMSSVEPNANLGTSIIIRMSDYAVVGCLTSVGAAGLAVGTPWDKIHMGSNVFNVVGISTFDR